MLWRPRANRRKKEGRGSLRGQAVAASLTLAHTLCGFHARIAQRKIADPPLPSIVLPCRAREVMRSFLSSPDSRGILVGACCDRDKGMRDCDAGTWTAGVKTWARGIATRSERAWGNPTRPGGRVPLLREKYPGCFSVLKGGNYGIFFLLHKRKMLAVVSSFQERKVFLFK